MAELRSNAFTFTAAIAAIGIAARAISGGGSAGEQARGAAGGPQEQRAAPAALVPADRFAGMGAKLLAASMGRPGGFVGALSDTALDVMVATVPDPVDSHEDWAYDADLEAIRRAHEQEGYAVDRMWLPWALGGDSVVSDTFHSRTRQAYPGVLLFRSSEPSPAAPGRPRFRIVYLVGEVPTAGVHPLAMRAALTERDRLMGRYPVRVPVPGSRGDTLHVLGPTFSGSAAGLRALLDEEWRASDPLRRVRIITGSVTSEANRDLFTAAAGYDFGATVNSDDALRSALRRDVLPKINLEPRDVALLVEGSTAYGRAWQQESGRPDEAQVAGKIHQPVHPLDPSAVIRGLRSIPEKVSAPVPASLKGALVITFPMNIGSFRDEYGDQLREARRGQQPQEAATGPTVSITDAARPMETPPPASRLTAASVGLMLDELAGTLRGRGIDAVVIAASDVRDRLFLVSELGARLRDVQFIVPENNALYLTPEYNRDLRGMLVLSTYPLLPETQLWGEGHEVVPFPGEFAEGVYNAALLHLGSWRLVDYAYPDSVRRVRRPPVWISAVGSGAMVPLAVASAAPGYVVAADSARIATAAPDPGFGFLTGVRLFATLAGAGWLLYACLGHLWRVSAVAKEDDALLEARLSEIRSTLDDERARRKTRLLRVGRFLQLVAQPLPKPAPALPAPLPPGEPAAEGGEIGVRAFLALAAQAFMRLVRGPGGNAPARERRTHDDPRIRAVLARYADWATLRCQEALYRFLFAAAAVGGLVPGIVLLVSATVRAHGAFHPWVIAIAAVLLAACIALGAVWAVSGGPRPAKLGFWGAAAALAGTSVYGMLGLDTSDEWIAAAAVVLTGGTLLLLVAALTLSVATLARWVARHSLALGAFRRRDPGPLWGVNVWARRFLLLVGVAYVTLTAAYAWEIVGSALHDRVQFTLLFSRGSRFGGGMSPVAPLVLAALAMAAWASWHLRRIRTLRQMTAFEAVCLKRAAELEGGSAASLAAQDPDAGEWGSAFPRRAAEGVQQVRDRLTRLVPDGGAIALCAVLLLVAGCVVLARYHSMERVAGLQRFDWLYRLGLLGMVATTAWAVYRLLAVWRGLNRTLRAISGTPLVTAFERLPRRISRLTRMVFLGTPRSAVVAPVAAAQWRHLKSLSKQLNVEPAPVQEGAAETALVGAPDGVVGGSGGQAAIEASQARGADAGEGRDVRRATLSADEVALRNELAAYVTLDPPATGLGDWGQEAGRAANLASLGTVLEKLWIVEPREAELKGVAKQVEGGEGESGPSTSGRIRRTTGDVTALWFRAAEEFAAVQVVDYVEAIINQMRVLALFIFASLILVTLHEGAYPYQPQSLLKLILFALLAGTVGALVKVMIEMNRDEILSRIAHTEPGKVTWDTHFVLNLAVFGLVPVISLIGSEFPSVREFLLGWMPTVARLLGAGG
jgi:hypothetical protein